MLEVFNNLFAVIRRTRWATGMQNTAYSVTIKGIPGLLLRDLRRRGQPDRRRPAHAGAPGLDGRGPSRPSCAEERRPQKPGDAYVVQRSLQRRRAPTRPHGPSRRCSTTRGKGKILFYVGSRGHHSDIGGTGRNAGLHAARLARGGRTGSVLFASFRLVRDGEFRRAAVREVLGSGEWPARNPGREHRRHAGADLAARRKGRARACSRMCATSSAWTWCAPTWATCRTTPRRPCAA